MHAGSILGSFPNIIFSLHFFDPPPNFFLEIELGMYHHITIILFKEHKRALPSFFFSHTSTS